ncbi:MAG: RNA polymerase [Syntrophobacterales bacterium CG_4_8_14_3_um_filter_58_8]|nr:MAG: hypothetical protein AUK26_14505 [Syntrophaceae bacterium CG2_30_58_14]PIV07110.1 MAG: RNA polymerase [Syntrophobacterales bacterium CG03_land_8_20_14_0_80_58_14]PJC72512.1 MAG: RNA polymerase [Syntrophobacterales bacterium CG_4_8_14_3_um_filter_58_8]
MTPNEENEIIERVLNGDRDAYAFLVDAYQSAIFNLVFRMTGSYQDADDLAQETFFRAYRNLGQFCPGKRFFTWLYTIALNLIRNHLKKQGRRMFRESQDFIKHRDGVVSETARRDPERIERNGIQTQKIDHLQICLQKLPADLREAVILRFYQDLSFVEIAAVSDASVSAVKMRVYRGIEKLKQLMGEDKM